MRSDRLDQGSEARVEQHHAILGVIDDVYQLVRVQAGIAGVHQQAAARYRVVGFQMAVIVPGDGGGRGALLQVQAPQGVREFADAGGAFSIGVAKSGTVRLA
ncbi:MAG: hypothetical protein NVS9B2_03550 [Steroidobacteraceae bacterium]